MPGYNWLVRRNKVALERVRNFSSDIHSVLLSGARSAAASRSARAWRPRAGGGLAHGMSVGPSDGDVMKWMSAINTTLLVDVMLVLLIIFLLTIPVVTKQVELTLPTVTNEALVTKPENITLSIDKKGYYYWNGNRSRRRSFMSARSRPLASCRSRKSTSARIKKCCSSM